MLHGVCKFLFSDPIFSIDRHRNWIRPCARQRAVAREFAFLRAVTLGTYFRNVFDLFEFRCIALNGLSAYKVSVSGWTFYSNAIYVAIFAESLY